MAKRVAVATALLVVVAVAVGAVAWWRDRPAGDLARATALAPPDAERLTWTDWRGIRAELGSDVDASSTPGEVREFLDAGYEADLTSTSALLGSTEALQQAYGVSPASLDWELFSQSEAGAVVLMRLADEVDLDALRDGFEDLGYLRPDDDDGVWEGGADLLARIGGLTPQLQFLAISDDDRLLMASDASGYLVDAVAGIGEGVPDSLVPVVDAVGPDPLSAVVYDAAYVCGSLAMGQADETAQAEADRLLAEAGEVTPLTGFSLAAQPDGRLRVAMSFETDEQARANADSRAALLRGPAPGQGGSFADRFEVEEVTAEGSVVTADLVPEPGGYVISDLSSGPVLFATC